MTYIGKESLENYLKYELINYLKYEFNRKEEKKHELINGIKHNDFWYKTTVEINDRASSTIILYGSKNNTNWIELKNVTVLN